MDGLRQKLESQGLKDVAYMVVNQQGEQAQRLHAMLAQRLSVNITLYQQSEQQPDVWQALGGEKDDFLIYDRCGRLTRHISLPYSVIGPGHVESGIKEAYCSRTCGDCTHESVETPVECAVRADAQPEADAAPAVEDDAARGHHHGHHHGHGHHGGNHGVQPHGQDHHHGRQHGDHDGAGQQAVRHQGQEGDGRVVQHQFELGQMQEATYVHQMQQGAHGANVRP